jgi:hypothetical protein
MSNRKTQIIALLLILAGLFANQRWMASFHQEETINRGVANENIPPTLALVTFALGPLRALVVDALWWRAIQQQDRGEFFDAMQLTEGITKLQPTYASVWAYMGWNMAYNIAFEFAEPEDRWQWILRAIELLRDEGLTYNPDNSVIRHELARIFYHKIGGEADTGGEYFKNQWTFLMMRYFQEGGRRELRSLEAAAKTLDELRAKPDVAKYAKLAREKFNMDVFNFTMHQPRIEYVDVDMPGRERELAALEIYFHYRRTRIEQELNLDISKMLFIDRNYGPLDWRLHQAHAIYWAAEGEWEDYFATNANYAEVVRQSMTDAFYNGRLMYDEKNSTMVRTENLRMIKHIHNYYDEMIQNHYSPIIDAGHKKFLERAITILYSYNRLSAARELFDHYKIDYLQDQKMDYETFVLNAMRLTASTDSRKTERSLVELYMYQALQWMMRSEFDRSNGYFRMASVMWQRNQKRFENNPAKLLPSFESLLASAKTKYKEDNAGLTEEGIQKKVLENFSDFDVENVDVGDYIRGEKIRPEDAELPGEEPAPEPEE